MLKIYQYLRVSRVLLTEYRSTWPFHLFFGFVMPIGMIFFLTHAGAEVTPQRATFILGGNLVSSIAYGPVMVLIGKIGVGRQTRAMDYWANLPVSKLTWVLAMVTVSLLLAVPGIASVYLVGCFMLGLPLAAGLALLPLIPLGALSLTGLGAFIGAFAKDGPTANILGNAFIGCVTFLSPLMVPLEAMPLPMQWIARLMPTTYVASAFRSALQGNFGAPLAYDVLILVSLAAAFLLLVQRKLDWRAG